MSRSVTGSQSKKIVLSGLFLALGLIIPYITSHGIGLSGTIFLPMHLSVLLAGFVLGPSYGGLVGFLTPLLSSLLTGMPPLYPMLPMMLVELTLYGILTGYFYHRRKLPLYPSLFLAMVGGRVGYGVMYYLLLLSNTNLKALSVWGAITTGLPGIILQLLLVPLLVKGIESVLKPPQPQSLEQAKALLKSGTYSCVVCNRDQVLYQTDGRGVSPLLQLYETQPGLLRGNWVADKIIGKAAAMILVLAGAEYVYGQLMSQAAVEYLQSRQISCSYGRCVQMINNRNETGICPLERAVMDVDDPEEGYRVIKETVARLKAATTA